MEMYEQSGNAYRDGVMDLSLPVTFGDFVAWCFQNHYNENYRLGQSMVNKLHRIRPDLYDELLNAPGMFDPYYDNNNISNFLDFLCERWKK